MTDPNFYNFAKINEDHQVVKEYIFDWGKQVDPVCQEMNKTR